MANHRSSWRDLLVPALGRLLALVGLLLTFIGLFGALNSVIEQGWHDGLFTGKSVVFPLMFPAGILVLKWAYPLLTPR